MLAYPFWCISFSLFPYVWHIGTWIIFGFGEARAHLFVMYYVVIAMSL